MFSSLFLPYAGCVSPVFTVCLFISLSLYIYIYMKRERERERERYMYVCASLSLSLCLSVCLSLSLSLLHSPVSCPVEYADCIFGEAYEPNLTSLSLSLSLWVFLLFQSCSLFSPRYSNCLSFYHHQLLLSISFIHLILYLFASSDFTIIINSCKDILLSLPSSIINIYKL